jgi:hypothetical protein
VKPAGATGRCVATKDATNVVKNLPDSNPILRRDEARIDVGYYIGAAGWGWGGGVALGQQRREGGSKSA